MSPSNHVAEVISAQGSTLRAKAYAQLDPAARATGLSMFNRALVALILMATGLAIAETEPLITRLHSRAMEAAEAGLAALFLIEYLFRMWAAPEGDGSRGPWSVRLRFIFSPAAVIDLVSIVACLSTAAGSGVLVLRLVRLMRILRVAKLGRMSRALRHVATAVASRRDELLLSLSVGMLMMLVAATLLYLAEGAVQPDKFGSIPRAMWWAVATLTTIGYGDVYPITPLGKVLAAITAIASIGLIAMPTGILAAAFSDALQRHHQQLAEDEAGGRLDPRSGAPLAAIPHSRRGC